MLTALVLQIVLEAGLHDRIDASLWAMVSRTADTILSAPMRTSDNLERRYRDLHRVQGTQAGRNAALAVVVLARGLAASSHAMPFVREIAGYISDVAWPVEDDVRSSEDENNE